jgi:hypothetical protein
LIHHPGDFRLGEAEAQGVQHRQAVNDVPQRAWLDEHNVAGFVVLQRWKKCTNGAIPFADTNEERN